VHFLELAEKYASPELKFYVAGEIDNGNPNAISSEALNSYASPNIEYLGFIDDMPALLSQKSIFVYPSYYGEGVPKVMLEAATSGMPILTTDHPGCRDAVTDGFALLCKPNDYNSLEQQFKVMLLDIERLKEMSNNAMSFASANFSVENIIVKHLEVYSEI
jgi:glycosyltransferase involved in cell wall biosynthesis